jgi:hypothetical protein
MPVPQGRGPGTQQRIDQVFTMLVRLVWQGGRFLEQCLGDRVESSSSAGSAVRSCPSRTLSSRKRRPGRSATVRCACSAACACTWAVQCRTRAQIHPPALCRDCTRRSFVRPLAVRPGRWSTSMRQPPAGDAAPRRQDAGTARWWCLALTFHRPYR